jgi:hypothetical protein
MRPRCDRSINPAPPSRTAEYPLIDFVGRLVSNEVLLNMRRCIRLAADVRKGFAFPQAPLFFREAQPRGRDLVLADR